MIFLTINIHCAIIVTSAKYFSFSDRFRNESNLLRILRRTACGNLARRSSFSHFFAFRSRVNSRNYISQVTRGAILRDFTHGRSSLPLVVPSLFDGTIEGFVKTWRLFVDQGTPREKERARARYLNA